MNNKMFWLDGTVDVSEKDIKYRIRFETASHTPFLVGDDMLVYTAVGPYIEPAYIVTYNFSNDTVGVICKIKNRATVITIDVDDEIIEKKPAETVDFIDFTKEFVKSLPGVGAAIETASRLRDRRNFEADLKYATRMAKRLYVVYTKSVMSGWDMRKNGTETFWVEPLKLIHQAQEVKERTPGADIDEIYAPYYDSLWEVMS